MRTKIGFWGFSTGYTYFRKLAASWPCDGMPGLGPLLIVEEINAGFCVL